MATAKIRIIELAPCGVYCGACPSFNKTCKGCASNDKNQKRISKFGCAIRNCCYEEKQLDFCINCDSFPCQLIFKKLLKTHKNDPKFAYRHEIPSISRKMKEMGIEHYLEFQKQRWKCDGCGGVIQFYIYKCANCGKKKMIR